MNRRQKIIVSITGIFIVMLALVGLTYAYFLTRITGNENEKSISVTTAKLELVYSDNTPEVNLTGIIPITQDKVKTEGLVKKFTVSKTEESSDVYTIIKLGNLNVSNNLALYDMKWALYQGETPISTGDFGGKTSGEIILATNQLINTTTGLEYSLYIWINETNLDQSDMMAGTLTGILDISGTDKPLNTLSSAILGENNINVLSSKPTFTTTSTDRGLYVEQGDVTKSEMAFPTYYYKGNITNNYVKFGTYQESGTINYIHGWYGSSATFNYNAGDSIVWRIVRINEDGSIKLISENPISEAVKWATGSWADYINPDGTDSVIKSTLEGWYNKHLANTTYDSKVLNSSFCSDVSDDYHAARNRLWKQGITEPIFICSPGAINVYEKVATITADEVFYAGGQWGSGYTSNPSNVSYLSNHTRFWTMTPSGDETAHIWQGSLEYLVAGNVTLAYPEASTMGILTRAVINVSPDVIVTDGDGLSEATAYVIE